ncbi:MAG: 5-formyltetrahydrofolate cyclo-ligase [bacterium]|nr:5-formyltetrahydrofolate cyclo-ligase [bacterium]MCX7917168.1 5-formyltetrahydrofolate cyclo-ligase [bacterium]MDW8163131.1 5-formyltetrahydrofolate cyclo-ligase [Candidatus Omnitrophota bacterium]
MNQKQKKKEIREKIREIRETLDFKEWEEKSLKIQERFLLTDYYKNSKVIFTYFHFDREVKTDIIIKKCFEDEKIVCIPYIDWKSKVLIPSEIKSFDEIIEIKGIPGPKILNPVEIDKIDIIIVPGVVFDIYKNRIGMGGGFYDRYLKDISEKTLKVALSFDFQVLNEELPVDKKDIKVNKIITEERIID